MKKFWVPVIFAVSFLCSCGKAEEAAHYEFPDTTWEMSEEEVRNACKITEENISYSDSSDRSFTLITEDYEVFGEKAQVFFQFIDMADNGNQVLSYIQVYYPENADMETVLQNMKKAYGEPKPEVTYYQYFSAIDMMPYDGTESDTLKIWADDTIADTIANTESDAYREILMPIQHGLNEDNWEEFSQNARMVTVRWSTEDGRKEIVFDALKLVAYEELQKEKN